ncbi:murein DD-endopeptidase MepM [Lachnospiraceae bacterium]|nr:murein DD-endopeptidase MepM [Lachnospiraceae bacterium]
MPDEQLHMRDKVVEQMSRQGLVEENITQGTTRNISLRQQSYDFQENNQAEYAMDQHQNKTYYQNQQRDLAGEISPDGPAATGESFQPQKITALNFPDTVPAMESASEDLLPELAENAPTEFASLAGRVLQEETGRESGEGRNKLSAAAGDLMERKIQRMKYERRERMTYQKNQTSDTGISQEDDYGEETGEKKEKKEKDKAEGEEKDNREKESRGKSQRSEEGEIWEDMEDDPEEPSEKRLKKEIPDRKLKFNDHSRRSSRLQYSEKITSETQKQKTAQKDKNTFQEDTFLYRESLSRKTYQKLARKSRREAEEKLEEDMDPEAKSLLHGARAGLRTASYLYQRMGLSSLRSAERDGEGEEDTWEPAESSGRLQEYNEPGQNPEPEGKTTSSAVRDTSRWNHTESRGREKLKEGSRYLKEPEVRNTRKEYQKKINQSHAMEAAQEVRKKQEFIGKAKEAVKKAAAAAKSGAAVMAGILVFILLIFAALFLVIFFLIYSGETGLSAFYSGLYHSTYSDISDIEAYFRELETDLEEKIAGIEDEAAYSDCYEFIYELGNIGHKAVDLMSYIATRYQDFTLEMCKDELDGLFAEMYQLEIEVVEEEREIEKEDAEGNPILDENGNPETETVLVKICYVTLTVKEWDEIMSERLSEGEQERYSVYKLSQGAQQVYANPLGEDWKDKISSRFGYRIHPITKEKKFHAGIDIAVPEDTPLYSCTEGVVTISTYSESAGNYIVVLMESGYSVKYMHLNSLGVSAGEEVTKGMLIGATGNTGRSTGPHLHVEVRTPDNQPIDPTFIISNGVINEEGD